MRIRVEGVEFRYGEGEFALAVPSLRIEGGATAAVIGPSGSGKTTLLHLIAGIRSPQTGRIFVGETEITGLGPSACRALRIRQIGLVFQEFELLDYLSILDNILLPCRLHSGLSPTRELRDRAAALADEAGIADKLKRRVTRLSHGERQRVALCRALLLRPSVVLADEPTGNLDPANKDRALDILLNYTSDSGATLLAVTHDHSLLGRFDRVFDSQDFRAVPTLGDSLSDSPKPAEEAV